MIITGLVDKIVAIGRRPLGSTWYALGKPCQFLDCSSALDIISLPMAVDGKWSARHLRRKENIDGKELPAYTFNQIILPV